MKVGVNDIISKSTLRSSGQLVATAAVVLATLIWSEDFKNLSIAGVAIIGTSSFYWISGVALTYQLISHFISWWDDFRTYKQFGELAKDVGKRLDQIINLENLNVAESDQNNVAKSDLAGYFDPGLKDLLDGVGSTLELAGEIVKANCLVAHEADILAATNEPDKKHLVLEHVDKMSKLEDRLRNLPEQTWELSRIFKALTKAVNEAHPRARGALRASFWNFFVFRGVVPLLIGTSALVMTIYAANVSVEQPLVEQHQPVVVD